MWKDFFYYSKSERRAIIVLLAVALVLSTVLVGRKYLMPAHVLPVLTEDEEIRSFLSHLSMKDSLYREKSVFHDIRPLPQAAVLRPFDPNKADSSTFRSLGLPSFVVRNILRYREKGGIFHTPESFARIYGLSEASFSKLKPYIVIDVQSSVSTSLKEERDTADFVPVRSDKYAEGTVIDLNLADTASLKRIPGIGRGLAGMIVNYRKRLGGFYAVTQLQEIPYLDAELNHWFVVKNPQLEKLRVNRAGLDELRSHPYMDFYKARAILEYRRKRGNIKGLSQLSMMEEFAEKDLERLLPYLSFD
ncbi:helix-hairpin-helix domain-containing protein [uncultured Bacteroides sp.]|jgi:DNA uptake protein ComE-like DNA-binding protein|uniref:ComEA family DNA-binding protein n=1 Tax=uncultured Bacteroides sp. TaxID=162156 RepID=UPI00280B404F|nr:helix-hairpin-helix domain-containing protein [uncultured Bacteroides sp.]